MHGYELILLLKTADLGTISMDCLFFKLDFKA
ncbi:hypothetical protein J2X86_001378 [Acinetobacter lwoffii]|jgi:hypothetical protein|uniref:Uncharacterized protein n=1 Tax=Acinetobacter lwoffii TaxID=28090 RepID=A0AAW8LIJ2_ACILW|nr:hypothetical protein [Acinetobacter lwoffii]